MVKYLLKVTTQLRGPRVAQGRGHEPPDEGDEGGRGLGGKVEAWYYALVRPTCSSSSTSGRADRGGRSASWSTRPAAPRSRQSASVPPKTSTPHPRSRSVPRARGLARRA